MILAELQAIKRFHPSLDCPVTLKDITEKEHALGLKLPTALKEFYLTFSEDDPIFSAYHKIVPPTSIRNMPNRPI